MPFPTMIDPRNAVFELSSVMLKGGRLASAKASTVATDSGRNSAGTLRRQPIEDHQREHHDETTSSDETVRSSTSAAISSAEIATSPVKPTRSPGA